MDLTKGNIVRVSYYTKKTVELSDEQKQKNRTAAMGAQIEATLNQMLWGQANQADLQKSVGKGYGMAKDLDNQEVYDMKSVWVQIGHKETDSIISQIENGMGFVGWVDPLTIEDIKDNN